MCIYGTLSLSAVFQKQRYIYDLSINIVHVLALSSTRGLFDEAWLNRGNYQRVRKTPPLWSDRAGWAGDVSERERCC